MFVMRGCAPRIHVVLLFWACFCASLHITLFFSPTRGVKHARHPARSRYYTRKLAVRAQSAFIAWVEGRFVWFGAVAFVLRSMCQPNSLVGIGLWVRRPARTVL